MYFNNHKIWLETMSKYNVFSLLPTSSWVFICCIEFIILGFFFFSSYPCSSVVILIYLVNILNHIIVFKIGLFILSFLKKTTTYPLKHRAWEGLWEILIYRDVSPECMFYWSRAGGTQWTAKGQTARGKALADADFPLLCLAVFPGLWLVGLLKC